MGKKNKRKNELIEIPLEQKIIQEENPQELQELIELFNLNLKKKDIIRASKLSEVQDKIVDQMSKRVESRPDEFSNSDLLNYHKTVEETLSKSDTTLDSVNIPNIQINQQLNINSSENNFDKDSRKRILDTVNEILEEMKNDTTKNID